VLARVSRWEYCSDLRTSSTSVENITVGEWDKALEVLGQLLWVKCLQNAYNCRLKCRTSKRTIRYNCTCQDAPYLLVSVGISSWLNAFPSGH
jgi:hypothetical protein